MYMSKVWLKVSLLASGMRLLDNSGKATLSVVNQTKPENRDTVFNFEVKDFRTYHNCRKRKSKDFFQFW